MRLEQLGGYTLLGELGRGAMGVVFRARKAGFERELALKVIAGARIANPVSRERFRREAKLLAKVRHPGVLRVHDAGEEQGVLWYAMDLVAGESLEERIVNRGPLGESAARLLLEEIALAVAAIHDEGIVHRDLKPANVLLDKVSGKPLIADFGLARDLESMEQRLTRSGFSVGTPSYMAPEQIRAQKDTDARADVYALGAILYFVLTGQEPFVTATLEELIRLVLEAPPRPPSAIAPSVSAELDEVCLAALAKERDARPKDARAFAEALAALPVAREAARRRTRARALVYAAAACAAGTLIALGPLVDWRRASLFAERDGALEASRREATRLAAANKERVADLIASARALLEEKSDEEALAAAREALHRAPRDPVVLAVYASTLLPVFVEKKKDADERFAAARRAIERARALAPEHPTVLLARARLDSFDRAARAGVPDLLRAVFARGDRRDKLSAVSLWLVVVGPTDLDPLLAIVDACVKDGPSWAHAHLVRGEVLDALGRYADARVAYEACLGLSPRSFEARTGRAYDAERLDDYATARADWRALLERRPDDADLHFMAGCASEKLGDEDDALREYDRAIELWPRGDLCPVFVRRGALLYDRGESARALPDLERAARDTQLLPTLERLAGCYTKLDRRAKARETWDRVLAQDPRDLTAILAAGALREQDGSIDACRSFYRAALDRLVDADARAAVQERLAALDARAAKEKLVGEKEHLDLARARANEVDRRLKEIQAELDATKPLPAGPEKDRRLRAIKAKLDELDAYEKETDRIFKK